MTKRNITLVQVDILRKTPMFTTTYLPYGVAALWAFAKQSPAVHEHFALQELVFMREPIADVLARMHEPFLVGFSCYIWNTEYNKALAKAIKQRWPQCLILFGGHNVPPGATMLQEEAYIDFLIHGEGEIPLQRLLEELAQFKPNYATVPGLVYRNGDDCAENAPQAAQSVEEFPSPYLTGVFDDIVAKHPEIQWCTVWETNRGCPNHCAFCDWGQHNARVRQFTMQRLLDEIAWFSQNKVEYIWCADANFGMLERDEEIINVMAATKAETGYPMVFLCQSTKQLNERLFRIAQTLNESGLDKLGPNFAVQSLNPEVLHNIGRRNMPNDELAYWLRRYRNAGYRTHTDLILGLPGETLQSFCAGVETLFELGQHAGIYYFPCSLLPNAAMAAPAYREKHGLRTLRKIYRPSLGYFQKEEQIDEYIDVIDQTACMPQADLLTASFFMFLAQGLHSFGMIRLVAMHLHTQKIANYADFYRQLLDFCEAQPHSLPGEIMAHIISEFTQANDNESLEIAGFNVGRMAEDQYVFGRTALEPERFYTDIAAFLQQFGLDAHLLAQLLSYQRECMLLPGSPPEKLLDFDYDFPAYFAAIYDGTPIALQKKPTRVRFSHSHDLTSHDQYFDAVVRLARMSDNAFYRVEVA
ncbi:MAG: radical SAM protein [Oscillospiraceae bacterium]|nr:radical SAM protein [Oscillospiraceae bacterium]